MNKRLFNWMLAAALMCGLSMSVTSCKDDDVEPKKEEPTEQEVQQKASKFWSVVGQLVSVDDATEDYEDKTFEATYGIADATNPTTRIVNTNDMKTAAQRFANLVDATGINENTPSYKWSDPDIGSMTYTRSGTAAEWATVDVDIKAVPGLQKIIYRAGGEGDNGKFEGKAYYRFGDVVSREVKVKYDEKKNNDDRGTITEYWICVRPAFGPEGKEDSHWVCVNTVSDKNYKYYHGSNDFHYWLPTALKTDKENMQNFAEMLYAICRPQKWYDNVNEKHTDGKLWGFSGVPFFADFKKANLYLHNQYFWKKVRQGWIDAGIPKTALNIPSMWSLDQLLTHSGVRLLYNGYSWWFTTSWNCELWEAIYTNGTKDEELNMHHAEYKTWEQNMQSVNFDVRTMGNKLTNYNDYFYDQHKRWVIRHATGKELASNKKFDVKKPIEGVTEVYRYYRDVVKTTDLTQAPERTAETDVVTPPVHGFFYPGVFIQDDNGTRWMCVESWLDDPEIAKSAERKAYFISMDGLTTATENIGSRTGKFLTNDDLVPESKAALISAQLTNMACTSAYRDWGNPQPYGQIKDKFKEYFNFDLNSLEMLRDTTLTLNGVSGRGTIQPLSIFYKPSDGRKTGTQPYFRFVDDGSHVGDVRTKLPAYLQYRYGHFFKKYNDSTKDMLDATHLFTASNYITEAKPVKADQWSICVNQKTGQREGDFKASDRYTDDFDWKLFHERGYKSAYHEPIVAVRYLELDDNSTTFQGTYNGKRYTIIYHPEAFWEEPIRRAANINYLQSFHNYLMEKYNYLNNGCYLDGQPYEPNIYTWFSGWDD